MTANRRQTQKRNFLFRAILLMLLPLGVATLQAAEQNSTQGSVARAVFTSQILDREPVDELHTVPVSLGRVFFFTDLRGLEGQIISHRWEYQGKQLAEIKFKVGGPRWRVYSSKNLLPEWTGLWRVSVSDQNGAVISSSEFEYTP